MIHKHQLNKMLEALGDMSDSVECLEAIAASGSRISPTGVNEARTLAVGFALDASEVLTCLLSVKRLEGEIQGDIRWRRVLRRRAQEAVARFSAAMSSLSPWTGLRDWTLRQTHGEAHLELKFEPAKTHV